MRARLAFARAADEDYGHAIDWYLAEAPHEVERFMAQFEAAVAVLHTAQDWTRLDRL